QLLAMERQRPLAHETGRRGALDEADTRLSDRLDVVDARLPDCPIELRRGPADVEVLILADVERVIEHPGGRSNRRRAVAEHIPCESNTRRPREKRHVVVPPRLLAGETAGQTAIRDAARTGNDI